jgi:hypothetical protein
MTELSNSSHKDFYSKYLLSISTFISIAVITALYGIFQAQVVFAGDLEEAIQPLRNEIEAIKRDNKATHEILVTLARGQNNQQVLYYEDQIRILEVANTSRSLTAVEVQRLSRYKADLAKINK